VEYLGNNWGNIQGMIKGNNQEIIGGKMGEIIRK
jgi:hypothetical protein